MTYRKKNNFFSRMVIVYGVVYGPQLIGFTERGIVLRVATVYGDRVWSVYGLRV